MASMQYVKEYVDCQCSISLSIQMYVDVVYDCICIWRPGGVGFAPGFAGPLLELISTNNTSNTNVNIDDKHNASNDNNSNCINGSNTNDTNDNNDNNTNTNSNSNEADVFACVRAVHLLRVRVSEGVTQTNS